MATFKRDLSLEDYISDRHSAVPSLSSHLATTLLTRSPAHAHAEHPRLTPPTEERESKFDLGSAAHDLLLLGLDNVMEVHADDWKTKAAKEQRDDARKIGLYPLLSKHAEQVRAMVEIALAARRVVMYDGGKVAWEHEVSAYWQQATPHGVAWLRARLDSMSSDRTMIVEYKTTDNASAAAFQRTVSNLGYGLQAVFHCAALADDAPGEPEFLWCVQETSPPYCVAWYSLPAEWWSHEWNRLKTAAAIWAKCMNGDSWPAYPQGVQELELPGWMSTRYAQEEVGHHIRWDLGSQA